MRFPRLTIVLAFLVVTVYLALRGQSRISELRRNLAASEARLAAVKAECAVLEAENQFAQSNVQRETSARNFAHAALAAETQTIATIDPESLWVDPPAELPNWTPDSPYVWLSKETLARLPFRPFSKMGELDPEMGVILDISDPERRNLNERLRSSLEEYRRIEALTAEYTTNHPPGISQFPGEKVTITVRPNKEESQRLQNEFAASLKSSLGDQRSDLILRRARHWLGQNFTRDGAEPKTYSATRHANGSYNISMQTGNSSMSVGGPMTMEEHIPAHLLPFFAALQAEGTSPPEGVPVAVPQR
jgi:hypothetical protein